MTIAWLMIAATLVVAYVLGSFPTGYLVAKSRGIDIQSVGSGSTGATNILRTLGKKAGAAVLICDILKGILAIYTVHLLYHFFFGQTICGLDAGTTDAFKDILDARAAGKPVEMWGNPQTMELCLNLWDYQPWIIVAAGMAAILGHSKSVWLGFKGGKSVATSLGVLLALNPLVGLGSFGLFAATAAVTKIVSISSIVAAGGAILLMVLLGQPLPYQLFALIGGGYVIWRHRANIDRLRKGTEPKIGEKIQR